MPCIPGHVVVKRAQPQASLKLESHAQVDYGQAIAGALLFAVYLYGSPALGAAMHVTCAWTEKCTSTNVTMNSIIPS